MALYCLISSLTSRSSVPEPLAIRLVRAALITFGLSLSSGVMESIMYLKRSILSSAMSRSASGSW